MKKIVLPIDGSARSQRTIAITKQIFHGQDAEITLLMVLPEPRYTDAQAMTRSSRGPLQKLGSVATYIVRNAQFLDLIVMREDVV